MRRYLFAFDFDQTIANTFEKGPEGIGVSEGYEIAVQNIFGDEGLQLYRSQGGLNNRAPTEVVSSLLSADRNGQLLQHANIFWHRAKEAIQSIVPDTKVKLDIPETGLTDVSSLTEVLVRRKLALLSRQIGSRFPDGSVWPRQCTNFEKMWKVLQELKQDGVSITTAIISSGHDKFIRDVFDLWQLPHADIMVTEDDVRGRKYPEDVSRRVKPGQLQLAVAHHLWLQQELTELKKFSLEEARDSKDGMIYFGDDSLKDGGLAYGARIPFGLFNGSNRVSDNSPIQFSDWRDVAEYLVRNQMGLREGKSMRELFEGFPREIESDRQSGVEM